MKVRTFMFTEWIEVHDHGLVYEAKVFLTNRDEAYMITVQDGKKRVFRIDPSILKTDEIKFFERVMEKAKEINTEQADKIFRF